MNQLRNKITPSAILVLSLLFSISCSNKTGHRLIIISRTSSSLDNHDFVTGESWRYLTNSSIITLDLDRPGKKPKLLTGDFVSACSPAISYDGKRMLFTGQLKQGDPWQIWEMNLGNLKSRKITSFNENCIDPDYLPGDRLVFSKATVNDTVKTAYCLFTCNLDGSSVHQITFNPGSNFETTVLKDGRLVTVSRQLLPVPGDPVLMVMRPDGTKADMFYKSTEGNTLICGARETDDGKIVFIEADKLGSAVFELVAVSYNRPLHSRINLTSGIKGSLCSVLPLKPGKYLVSARSVESEKYSLYEFDPDKSLGPVVYSDKEYNVIEAVPVEEYERPKKLPSEVDLQVKTGLLLCQDINFFNPDLQGKNSGFQKAGKIEVLGVDTTYGVVDVEKDGSFQLKVMADTPFRIRSLDNEGNVASGPCSWLWLRPNERRGCIGCHEDPELAPENKVSLAIRKPPVIIPVHITGIKEKIVELE